MCALPHFSIGTPKPETATDLEVIHEVKGGHREMFEIIVRRYNPQLYRVGMAYLRNHAQTEDAMQNTYLKAFMKLEGFAGVSAFSTWLTRIMINECLMLIRSQKRYPTEIRPPHDAAFEGDSMAPRAPDLLNASEMKTLLEQCIHTLPRAHRAVFIMREVQQLSVADTAGCLGMTQANVKVMLHRAREGLKTRLLNTAEGLELFEYSAPLCDPMTAKVMTAILSLR